jgi:hypothetical protein
LGRYLGDATLTAAILDRLAMHAIRIETRPRQAHRRRGDPAPCPGDRIALSPEAIDRTFAGYSQHFGISRE